MHFGKGFRFLGHQMMHFREGFKFSDSPIMDIREGLKFLGPPMIHFREGFEFLRVWLEFSSRGRLRDRVFWALGARGFEFCEYQDRLNTSLDPSNLSES